MKRPVSMPRRKFLGHLGHCFTLGSTAALLPQLGLIPRAMAQAADYRALVCIYLAGANASYNWLVPRDADAAGSHSDRYRTARGGVWSGSNTAGLALGFDDLLPIQPSGGAAFGLHPSCGDFTAVTGDSSQNHGGIQNLFNQGKAAFVCNAGPLVQPISKLEYNAGAPRPPQLFSHNDQELLWHIGMAAPSDPVARYGWGGRVAKSTAGGALEIGLSPSISVAGSARFLIGDGILPYQISPSGANTLDNYQTSVAGSLASARREVLDGMLADAYGDPFTRGYADTLQRSLTVGESLDALLNAADGSGGLQTVFPEGNSLADQLKVVASMIKVSRASLSATRQVFYVRYGSFDLHDGMFDSGGTLTDSGHGELLTALNQAVGAFWSALGEIGARDKVTTFTMSDFGRTLSGNGSGSDHAWGGNLMVLGDAVRGGALYGSYPQMVLNADDNNAMDWSFTRGQYIPTTSVDQVAATLARWMGVSDGSALDAMFPLLGNFASGDLGFMNT